MSGVFNYPGTEAWASYTPTVGATVGTITTSSSSGAWIRYGKIVFFRAVATITTNGTGAALLLIGLPLTAKGNYSNVSGQEIATTLRGVNAFIADAATSASCSFSSDGLYPGADGRTIAISGVYETSA